MGNLYPIQEMLIMNTIGIVLMVVKLLMLKIKIILL